MENVLTTYQLKKRYGKHMAVNGVDMHINRGDIYGFVGENGSKNYHNTINYRIDFPAKR